MGAGRELRFRQAFALGCSLAVHLVIVAVFSSSALTPRGGGPVEISMLPAAAPSRAEAPEGFDEPPPGEDLGRVEEIQPDPPVPNQPEPIVPANESPPAVESNAVSSEGHQVRKSPPRPTPPARGRPAAELADLDLSALGDVGSLTRRASPIAGPAGTEASSFAGLSVRGAGAPGRSAETIWNETQRYVARLRWSYGIELREEPTLQGVVRVRYVISASGTVGEVEIVGSDLGDATFEQEVARQVRGWTYSPEPSGDVVVTWPLSFVPPE